MGRRLSPARWALVAWWAGAVIGGVGGGLVAHGPAVGAAPAGQRAERLVVRELIVVDEAGRERARLVASREDVGLRLFDTAGRERVGL
ncbi:MAG TPA: hypothetical protein VFB73_16450, partial [Chloroflexota bacterium]|nr:hypothetical protein [Chloroflexota bacterium]